jgi:hypothetical protein
MAMHAVYGICDESHVHADIVNLVVDSFMATLHEMVNKHINM